MAKDSHLDLISAASVNCLDQGLGDGILVIVFDTKPTVVAAWLAGPPPLDSGPWSTWAWTAGDPAQVYDLRRDGEAVPGSGRSQYALCSWGWSLTIWFVARDSGASPRAPRP